MKTTILLSFLFVVSTLIEPWGGKDALAFDAPERVGITNQFVYGASSVSSQALGPNSNRAYLFIQNQSGASTLTVSFFGGSTVGLTLTTGQTYSGAVGSSVYLQSSAGIVNTLLLEGIH